MYRNMLVHIPTERSVRPAVDGSVSLALATGARLQAVAVGYISTNVPFVAEGGAAIASLYDIENERALERANAALALFETEAKNAAITYGCRVLTGTYAEAVETVGAMARLTDLTIVSQPEDGRDVFDNHLPQEMLFQSGGPVLFMPYTFKGAFRAARIGICWDGSRLAARALRDAMPLLAAADALIAITINEADQVPTDASPAQLAKYLAQLGLPIRIVSLQSDRANIQSSILSLAADDNIDLLVMGGYGHSRLQERVLGGVTRDMFRSMTVPTLMSH